MTKTAIKEISVVLRRFIGMDKRFVFAVVFIVATTLMSSTAEVWSNNKPLVMEYHSRWYFPAFAKYHPKVFGITDRLNVDYGAAKFKKARAIWPVSRWGPFTSDKSIARYPSPPSRQHWFGTDDRGRDIFARILYGFRYSLIYALLVTLLSSFLAVVIGGAMGYMGSWFDLIGQRVIEVLSSVPQLFLMLFLVTIIEPSLLMLGAVSSIFGWISTSYFIRGEALKCRKLDFVEAARASGASHAHIVRRHILPHVLTPLITFAPFMIVANISGLAVLDYLGFGLPPPTPSWGELLGQSQKYFGMAWWLAVFPALALFLTLLSFAFVGEGVRKILDPMQRSEMFDATLPEPMTEPVTEPVGKTAGGSREEKTA
jgi:microcin C transport system permease protein